MKIQRRPFAEIVAVVAAAAVLVALNVLGQERRQSSAPAFEPYSSLDAGASGYRAWYELLEREGLRVDRFERRAAFLDSTIGTLVYVEPSALEQALFLSEGDATALESWVRDGGALVYIERGDSASHGVLTLPGLVNVRPQKTAAVRSSIAGVRSLEVRSVRRWRARPELTVLVRDAAGALVVRYSFGLGRVTAVLDARTFDNADIGKADAPRLAFGLAQPSRPRSFVAFDEAVHGSVAPEHWWSIVPRPFLIATVVAAFVLLLAVAGAAMRLGPPVEPLDRRDLTSAQFIDSLAGLLERGNASRAAVDDAVRSTARRVVRAAGLSGEATPRQVAARLQRGDLGNAYLEMNAAAQGRVIDEQDMVRTIALAQYVRKEVRHGRTGD